MLAPVHAIRLLQEAEERVAREEMFRRTELEARQVGEYDAADAMRQVADYVASDFVHWPLGRGYVPKGGAS